MFPRGSSGMVQKIAEISGCARGTFLLTLVVCVHNALHCTVGPTQFNTALGKSDKKSASLL